MLESGTSARYSRALVLAGLLALSVVGCQGETTDAKSSGEPSETKQTLGLLEGLISNCNDMLEKLAGRKEDYASTGDVRGEQLMGEAAGNVKDIKSTALAMKSDVAPAETASLYLEDPATALPDVQAKMQEISEARDRLEANLAEARSCCGLDPDFLDENLGRLRTQTSALEEQIEPEPTVVPERSAQEQYS